MIVNKRWIAFLLTVLLITVLGASALAAPDAYVITNDNDAGERFAFSTYADLQAKILEIAGDAANKAKHYTITLNQDLEVRGIKNVLRLETTPPGKDISQLTKEEKLTWTIQGNGHTITKNPADTGTEEANDFVIAVGMATNAELYNVTVEGQEKFQNINVGNYSSLVLGDKVTVQNGFTDQLDTAGVYVFAYSSLVVKTGAKIINNHATTFQQKPGSGGGTSTHQSRGGGIGMHKYGKLLIEDGVLIENNSATVGGGIYALYGCELTINGATIKSNACNEAGGGLYLGTLCKGTLNGTVIDGNESQTGGGGIYTRSTRKLTMIDAKITNNKTTDDKGGNGGGLYFSPHAISKSDIDREIKDGWIDRAEKLNQPADITRTTFANNEARLVGGGICAMAPMNMTDSSVTGNKATYGGGIGGFAKLNVSLTSFDENVAYVGGGIYYYHDDLLTLANCSLTKNRATEGGGVRMYGVSANAQGLKVVGTAFKENEAVVANDRGGIGGGIYCPVPLNVSDQSAFTGNKAKFGGGIYVPDKPPVTIDQSTFTKNEATDAGGAIARYLADDKAPENTPAKMTITSSDFNENRAEKKGGALCLFGDVSVSNNSTFTGNSSNDRGGALYYLYGKADIENATFTNNAALYAGGAIGLYKGGDLAVSASNFTGNKTTTDETNNGKGGAIFSDIDSGTLSADKSYFNGNEARQGGALCLQNGGTVNESTFSGNRATGNGKLVPDTENTQSCGYAGAFSALKGQFTLTKSAFTKNFAEKAGGAMMVWPDAVMNISNQTTFVENACELGDGGAIRVHPYSYEDPADESVYKNLITDATTVFRKNRASASYNPPKNYEKFTRLKYASNSYTGQVSPYDGLPVQKSVSLLNNDDVNYKKPGVDLKAIRVPIAGTKKLAGGKLKAGDFGFTLKDASGKLLETIRNGEGGKIAFTDRTFSNEGSFTYVIQEVDEAKKGVTYDKTVYRATVKVWERNDVLNHRVDWEKDGVPFDGAITFNNRTKMPATGDSALMLPTVLTLTAIALLTVALYQKKRREQGN